MGIEYIKALYRLKSKITPVAIQREESHYHDTELKTVYSSATAIRKVFSQTENISSAVETLKQQMPHKAIPLLIENFQKRFPIYADDFSLLLKYRLLTETNSSLLNYMDINETLANRIYKNRNQFISFKQFCEEIKTRDITYTRVSRALLHILLQIKKEDNPLPSYAHILGFRKDSSALLSVLKQKSSIPLITKLSSASLVEKENLFLQQDIFASDLYESVVTDKFKTSFINEYKKRLYAVKRIISFYSSTISFSLYRLLPTPPSNMTSNTQRKRTHLYICIRKPAFNLRFPLLSFFF